MQKISESEQVLMKIIWKNGGTALFSSIMEELESEENEWKKNTVLTLLSRLIEKQYLRTVKIGRRNEYTALLSEQEFQNTETQDFIQKIYHGNVKGLVSTLLQQDIIQSDELQELKEFWRRQNE